MARNITSKNNDKYFAVILSPKDDSKKKYKKTDNYREFFF